jgi:hypothetical protein
MISPGTLGAGLVVLGLALSAVAGVRADVRLDVRETSWSAARQPQVIEARLRTEVSAQGRRVENDPAATLPDSLRRRQVFVQIDRVDRDSSYFVRPADSAYIAVPLDRSRTGNRRMAAALAEQAASGNAPPDTLPPVRVTDLGRTRTIAGIPCRGVVLDLAFDYQDSTLAPGTELHGVLSDTLWLAPPDSPAGELARFDSLFAHATGADSLLLAATDAQLAAVRGQGMVSIIERAVRRQPGYPLASSFVNLLSGLPRGLQGFERLPDGTAIMQRLMRETIALDTAPLDPGLFEPPADMRRVLQRTAGHGANPHGGASPHGGGSGQTP